MGNSNIHPRADKLFLYDKQTCLFTTASSENLPPKLLYPREVATLDPIGIHGGCIYCVEGRELRRLKIKTHEIEVLPAAPYPVKTSVISANGYIYALAMDPENPLSLLKYCIKSGEWQKFAVVPYNLKEPVLIRTKNFFILDITCNKFVCFNLDALEWSQYPIPSNLFAAKIYWFVKEGKLLVFDFANQKFLCFDERLGEWIFEVERKKVNNEENQENKLLVLQSMCFHPDSQEIYAITATGHLCNVIIDNTRKVWEQGFTKSINIKTEKWWILPVTYHNIQLNL